MEKSLVETVKFCFTRDVISQLSNLVGETELGVEKALSKSVPLLLNGLLRQVERGGAAPAALLDLVRDADSAEVLTQLSATNTTNWYERGTNLLLDLLGHTYRITVNEIAEEAGIQSTASGTLLQVAATAVLGVLGKFAVENDVNPAEFIHWLQSQKAAIGRAMLPEPAYMTPRPAPPQDAPQRQLSAPPPPPAAAAPTSTEMTAPRPESVLAPPAAEPTTAAVAAAAGLRWQWGALLLLAVTLGYVFGSNFFGRVQPPQAQPAAARAELVAADATEVPAAGAEVEALTPTAPAARSREAAPAGAARPAREPRRYPTSRREPAAGRYDQNRDTYVYDTGRPIVLTLADGTSQRVGANSTENRLYTFLATAAVQVDSVNRTKGWINFDRINFLPNKATLTAESWTQLRNVASVLKTFPESVVKIGGYSDSTGTALQNLQLSEERARTAMLALARMGVPLERLQAKGYGAKYFVVPNSTPSNRALNRRVSIRVVQK